MPDPAQARPPRLLLTGFEGFGAFPVNPSWELVQRLDGTTIAMVDVLSRRLPVNWADAWPALHQALAEVAPTWLLMLGLGSTRMTAGAEIRARNLTNPVRDNAGGLPPADDRIEPGGPAYRISTIPATLLVEHMQFAGVPAQVSSDAGGFLCNWVLYKALQAAGPPPLRGVGFIHLPPLPEQGGPPVTLDRWEAGLRAAIGAFVAGVAPLFATVAAEMSAERA